ncbi:MAG: M28 family metallopeptidase [Cyclobacteriaceae bacterium]|nr:M28 family metallopeptidase [Cyclobacteriaceae bacterium]
MKNLLILFLSTFIIISCQQADDSAQSSPEIIDGSKIGEHIKVLSSDEFGGRMPFTESETKTINYLKSQFQNIGVEPGNGDSYFQKVPMVEIDAIEMSPLKITGTGFEKEYNYKTDFVALTRRVTENISVENSELVFAGYGIIAPEYDWDDYKNLDVKGKTVLVLVNDPGFDSNDSTLFKGNAMTYYGRWTYKYEEAARQGATGIIIVHDTKPASYPWGVVENGWTGANLYLKAEDNNMSRCALEGWISLEVAKELFVAAGKPDYSFTLLAKSRDFKSFAMNLSVSISFTNSTNFSESNNVAGIIKGSEKPDEIIIYSAHWDHLGTGTAIDGDSIYNGAIDNASGTATLLEIARAFKNKEQPKRSVLFLAVTAEEQGLLGSAYYAENPIYPTNKSVAVINMDALMANGEMKDLTVVGHGQSELDGIAETFATQQGRYIIPDPEPGSGHFFRSDHFSFAKVGIPALYASGSYEHMTRGIEYTKTKSEQYVANNYHQPSDEYSDDWDMSGMVQDGTLFYQIGDKLSNDINLWPKWKKGSEFKAIRENN